MQFFELYLFLYKNIIRYGILILIFVKEDIALNKFEMTLRQLNFGKPLKIMADPMKLTKNQSDAIIIYDTKILEDYTSKDLIIMLNLEIAPGELVELALEQVTIDKRKGYYNSFLINAISKQGDSYWKNHSNQKENFITILNAFELNLSKSRYLMKVIDENQYIEIKNNLDYT